MRLALDELHDQVGAPVGEGAEVGDVDDAGMAGAAGGARLADEARRGHRIGGDVDVEDLDGDGLAERLMLGAVDDAGAAAAELVDELVGADLVQRRLGVAAREGAVGGADDAPHLGGEAVGSGGDRDEDLALLVADAELEATEQVGAEEVDAGDERQAGRDRVADVGRKLRHRGVAGGALDDHGVAVARRFDEDCAALAPRDRRQQHIGDIDRRRHGRHVSNHRAPLVFSSVTARVSEGGARESPAA